MEVLQTLLEYVKEFQKRDIPKSKYQPFLAALIYSIGDVPRKEKKSLAISSCEAFLANQ